ncbi:hypothetical protein SNEBB_009564 [Seison nebaliae]|nr:hypothetical protein SNEBB_009564 [Seison nebaliae]
MNEFGKNGWAPIHDAAYNGMTKSVVRYLEMNGAIDSGNVPPQLNLETADEYSLTPMMVAGLAGSLDTIRALIEKGANVEYVNKKNHTIIEICLMRQHLSLFLYLLRYHEKELNMFDRFVSMLDGLNEFETIAATKTLQLVIDDNRLIQLAEELTENSVIEFHSKEEKENFLEKISKKQIVKALSRRKLLEIINISLEKTDLSCECQTLFIICLTDLTGELQKEMLKENLFSVIFQLLKNSKENVEKCERFKEKLPDDMSEKNCTINVTPLQSTDNLFDLAKQIIDRLNDTRLNPANYASDSQIMQIEQMIIIGEFFLNFLICSVDVNRRQLIKWMEENNFIEFLINKLFKELSGPPELFEIYLNLFNELCSNELSTQHFRNVDDLFDSFSCKYEHYTHVLEESLFGTHYALTNENNECQLEKKMMNMKLYENYMKLEEVAMELKCNRKLSYGGRDACLKLLINLNENLMRMIEKSDFIRNQLPDSLHFIRNIIRLITDTLTLDSNNETKLELTSNQQRQLTLRLRNDIKLHNLYQSIKYTSMQLISTTCNICPMIQEKLIELGGIKPLLKQIKSSNKPDQKLNILQTIWAIGGRSLTRRYLVAKEIGIDILMELLTLKTKTILTQLFGRATNILEKDDNDTDTSVTDENDGIMETMNTSEDNNGNEIEKTAIIYEIHVICCEALISLCYRPFDRYDDSINIIGKHSHLQTIPHLLSSSSINVVIAATRLIGHLVIYPSYVIHRENQIFFQQHHTIDMMLALMNRGRTTLLRLLSARTLAFLTMKNGKMIKDLLKKKKFSLIPLIKLVGSSDDVESILAGLTLTSFSFNNPTIIELIAEHSEFSYYKSFRKWMKHENMEIRIHSAFQVVVLCEVFQDEEEAHCISEAIQLLLKHSKESILNQNQMSYVDITNFDLSPDDTSSLAINYIIALTKCCTGCSDAITSFGAIDTFIERLKATHPFIRGNAAQLIILLSHNDTSRRKIIQKCRHHSHLMDVVMNYSSVNNKNRYGIRLSDAIIADWQHHRTITTSTKKKSMYLY